MNSLFKMNNLGKISATVFLLFIQFFPSKKSTSHSAPFPDLNLVVPLSQAYAHNDYEHPNPLVDALAEGFTSIEVDIHLINDVLYVSHLRPIFPKKERTLTQLYLAPLYNQFLKSNGRFFPQSDQPIHLMIDFKTGKNRTYEKLMEVIQPYQEMFSYWENDQENEGAIRIIISGNRPIKKVLAEKKRWVQIDGRIRDLGKKYAPSFMPMVSDKFSKVCGWTVFSKRPSFEKLQKLNSVANKVHAEGKKFRLWKSPEDELVWETMLEQGVDIINTDSLKMLSNFLNDKIPQTPMANQSKIESKK